MTTVSESVRPDEVDAKTLRRVIIASTIGVFVEFFDYGVYGFLATIIAAQFFPTEDPALGLVLTFSVFALTFVIRPLGGLLFGILGDRVGRQKVMVIAVIGMSAATAVIGLLPSYSAIGWAAPILLVLARAVQGFSAGGEAPVAQTFIAEYAPAGKRGLYCSFGQWGGVGALLVGTLVSALFTQLLGPENMGDWGWRILFLLAIPLGIIGFYIRRRLQETPRFSNIASHEAIVANPLGRIFSSKENRRALLLTIFLPALNGSGYYVLFNYMPSYLTGQQHFTTAQGFIVTAVAVAITVIGIPIAGRLSDRFGRRKVLTVSSIAMGVLAFPCYLLMTQGSIGLAILGGVILAACFAGNSGIVILMLVELFPTRVRFTSVALGYNISTAVFGGTAPFVVSALITATGISLMPAIFIAVTAVITLLTLIAMPEMANKQLQD